MAQARGPIYLHGIWPGSDYDTKSPFLGKSGSDFLRQSFQPNTKISQDISYNYVGFNRASNNERVYSLSIVNTRSSYQFNKHFFLRALFQFDSSKRRMLTDFLASYELAPGTVFYAGYGSLIEKRAWRDDAWIDGEGNYLTAKRGLFFKASCLFRF